jgi:hypothetical protein
VRREETGRIIALMRMRFSLFPFAVLAPLVAAGGTEAVFRSGAHQTALIELYTSEGCSSCPPAEKWLGELKGSPGLWREFVPVAFHVNYWDHLGWRDALASKAFTAREHTYAEAWRASSVYTPCFVRNGSEWRPRESEVAPTAPTHPGALTVTWQPQEQIARVEFVPAPEGKIANKYEINVALLGSGIVSAVKKGENAGRELRHEFVALRLESTALKRDPAGTWSATLALPARTELNAPRHALAAWVTSAGRLAPVQATGGWLE